jgi:[ribosomal protein S5]-alanine N-acetyltransferase
VSSTVLGGRGPERHSMTVEIPMLRTDRLVLRPPTLECAELYDAFFTDAEASRHYGGPMSSGQAWARLAADVGYWQLQGFGRWVIECTENGEMVGGCGFWQGRGWPRELTWWLLPKARGTGIAAEASRAAITHAYDSFGWESVETYMEDDNIAAQRLVARLGGVKFDRRSFPDGLERDMYRFPRDDESATA